MQNPIPPAQASDEPMQVGWLNVKYGTFFHLGGLPTSQRAAEMLASGEIIRVYSAPRATADIEKLPPLPSTHMIGQGTCGPIYGYDDRQMQEYARAAIADTPRATADVEQIGGALHDALMKCCLELPYGYLVRVEVEKDSGYVEWSDPDDKNHFIDGEGQLSDDVIEAFDAILAATRGAKP